MTASEKDAGPACLVGAEEAVEEAMSRRSLIRAGRLWALPRRLTLASAALFAGVAARGPASASGSNYACCTLARPDQWCGSTTGNPPFWCNHGGFKRVWYCCDVTQLWGCGECISSTGTCFSGPVFYCSYAWNAGSC
jgi:hypothetical protein